MNAEQLEQAEEQPAEPRRRRRVGARKVTLSLRRATKTELRHLQVLNAAEPHIEERPRHRGDCMPGGCNAERPCPWAGCRYHLALEVGRTGALTINFPDREIDELPDTCALDVAERGGLTLEEVGARMNLTRERVRQYEDGTLMCIPDELMRALQEVR